LTGPLIARLAPTFAAVRVGLANRLMF